jgi:S-adenosylmethionine hydrolase
MAIITLTTDWGLKDYYAGAVKGLIYSRNANAVIVDISHQVPLFDIIQASFILKNSYKHFPEGTVHIVEVKAQSDKKYKHVAILHQGQYFIGSDNGIFALSFEEKPDKIIELNTAQAHVPFPTMSIYADIACQLSTGAKLESFGTELNELFEKTLIRATVDGNNVIRGTVIYTDIYGNVITNISKALFDSVGFGRKFNISLRRHEYEISTISQSYNDVPTNEKLALFNAEGYLEIALNEAKAATLLGIAHNDTIRLEFYDNTNS